MKLENLYPGSFASNCYLLTSGGHAALVDPSADVKTLLSAITRSGATLDMILLTHGHFDHMLSVDALKRETGTPILIHAEDLELPEDGHKNAFYTFFHTERRFARPDRALSDGGVLMLGEEPIRVIHTPGHTRGSVCYLCGEDSPFLLTGDTLFSEGFGRCDLYGGDPIALRNSLFRLQKEDPHLVIYPGHGDKRPLGEALATALPYFGA